MRRQEPTGSIRELPVHVIVMAKAPLAGRVKTRLCPPLSLEQAALVAEAALSDTLVAVTGARVRERTVVLDGERGAWIPPHFRVIAQRTGPFADRLAGAIADAYSRAPGPILLIGMDTPQLRADNIEQAATKLLRTRTNAVLGLAEDGGFWLIGTERPVEGMFDAVEMSTPHTGEQQLARLKALRLRCELLPKLRDVDEWSDALRVSGDAPDSAFAAAVYACTLATDGRGPQVARHG